MSVVNNNAALSFVRSTVCRIGKAFEHPKPRRRCFRKKGHISE